MVPRPHGMGDNRRLGFAALILGLALVTAAAWLSAASLRFRGAIDFVLAVYVCAVGVIVLVCLVLSPFDALTRPWLLVASAVVAGIAGAVWTLRGQPAAPPFGPATRAAGDALRDPVVAIPAVAVGLAFLYSAALAVATPPNDYDTLWYHLPRAAFWRQEHGIGYVERANDLRLDVFTPGSEIVSSWAMVLEGSERYAGLLQLAALVATMLAVAGIARRLGMGRRAAALSALLFASLPVVALQASTPLNDLVVASFLVLVVHFVLDGTPAGLIIGALALALAVATKATALLALPLLALVVLVVSPRRRWPAAAVAGAAGIALGAFWYYVNLSERGKLIPRFAPIDQSGPAHEEGTAFLLPAELMRMAVDAVDPAGSVGRDRYLYAVAAAIVLAAGLLAAARRRSRGGAVTALVAAAVVLVPVAFVTLHERMLRAYQRFWLELDKPDLAFIGDHREAIPPSPFVSWYGPLGLLLFLASLPLAMREVRRGALRRSALVLAVAPLIYAVLVALGLGYSIFHGRYLMPAVALAAVTWGLVLRVRALAWAAAVLAAVTVGLSMVHYLEKPAGFSVLGGEGSVESVWNESRLEVFARARAPGGGGPLRLLEERAKPGDMVAILIRQDDVSYPFFGADLDRRIVFVGTHGEGLSNDADWLVEAPGLDAGPCGSAWRSVPVDEPGWQLYRRVGLCPAETADS
jgi:hypothetical protein